MVFCYLASSFCCDQTNPLRGLSMRGSSWSSCLKLPNERMLLLLGISPHFPATVHPVSEGSSIIYVEANGLILIVT